jgi:diguanylate cyclase (GGDEF)-like protein/PAS domain S-box-containing protein
VLTIGFVANALVTLSYLSIAGHVVDSVLIRERRWSDNPLALATAMIFFTCAIGHGIHAAHYVLSAHGGHVADALTTNPVAVAWDVLTACVGIWYWSLRGLFPALRSQASMYQDPQARENAELAAALDALPQIILLLDVSAAGLVVRRANAAAVSVVNEGDGASLADVWTTDTDLGLGSQLLEVARTGQPLRIEVPFKGQCYDVTCVTWQDGLMVSALDISERVAAQRERLVAEGRLEEILALLPVGVALVSIDLTIISANIELSKLLGREQDDLLGRAVGEFVHPEDAAEGRAQLSRLVAGQGDTVELELRLLRADGHDLWVRRKARLLFEEQGAPQHILFTYVDVTARRLYESQLEHQANHDALTSLLNRRGFQYELERHANDTAILGARGGMVMLDLDNFKVVNDTLGHAAGDQLILSVSKVLAGVVRETDVVARLGGDEFAVLAPDGDAKVIGDLAERVVAAVRTRATTFSLLRDFRVTVSAGVAMFGEGLSAPDVLALADMALYDAKDGGRDQVAVATNENHCQTRTASNMLWLARVRKAVAEGSFVVFEQPIVDLLTDEVTHRELLVRLQLPDGTLALPASWLSIAESYDVITDVDAFMLRRAVDVLVADPKGPAVCVNISGRSMSDPRMLQVLTDALTEHPEVADRLVVEITETAAIAHVAGAIAFANTIRDLGARVAIDDFGAGFGSFFYVKHLPFDLLKIDGEFVANCMSNSLDRHIVQAISMLARALGREVVAEFVGDEPTKDYLRRIGVRYAQGYLTGRPEALRLPGQPLKRPVPEELAV